APEQIHGSEDEVITFELWKQAVEWLARYIPYYAKDMPKGVFKMHDALLSQDWDAFKMAVEAAANIDEVDG
ncbi:MAG TPA: hypothetical protein PLV25_04445, partial [Opitutales bacterium]|nr:hypothetical protein [Opitutales bacterium]